jgi:hypothetical protein
VVVNKLAKSGLALDCCGWYGMDIGLAAIVGYSLRVEPPDIKDRTRIYANRTRIYADKFELGSHIRTEIYWLPV